MHDADEAHDEAHGAEDIVESIETDEDVVPSIGSPLPEIDPSVFEPNGEVIGATQAAGEVSNAHITHFPGGPPFPAQFPYLPVSSEQRWDTPIGNVNLHTLLQARVQAMMADFQERGENFGEIAWVNIGNFLNESYVAQGRALNSSAGYGPTLGPAPVGIDRHGDPVLPSEEGPEPLPNTEVEDEAEDEGEVELDDEIYDLEAMNYVYRF